jgi:hypothetical protein
MNKKDYNYVASVEKAIAKKYGSVAVQDIRSSWSETREKEYLNQLQGRSKRREKAKVQREESTVGDIIISRKIKRPDNERKCPACKTYSFSSRDDLYMNRFQCCENCYIEHVEFRLDRWRSGWRPGDGVFKPPFLKRVSKFCSVFFRKLIRRIKKWLVF